MLLKGLRIPPKIDFSSIVWPAKSMSGRITMSIRFSAWSLALNFSFFQFNPRTPAVIEPPETLETLASFRNCPSSFNRISVPR